MVEATASSTFTEFNVRQDKGKPHFIRLHDSVVKNLEWELVGAGEQSGVLLGAIESGENCTIVVEEFERAAKLEERIRTRRPGSGLNVVGYYRSHPSSEFTLNAADRTLFQRCFPKDARLLLLVIPPKADAGTAMFFLGENGQLAIDRATVEFPFNLRELGAEESPAPRAAEKPKRSWKLAAAGAAVIASVVGLNALHVFDRQTPPLQPRQVVVEKQALVEQPVAATRPAPAPHKPQSQPVKSVKARATVTPPPKRTELLRPAPRGVSTAPSIPVPQPAQAPAPEPAAHAEAPVAPRPQNIERQASPVQSPKPLPLTPPRAIRQFAPIVRESVRRSIPGEVVIKVRVHVDVAGKVITAESLSKGSPIAEALASSAIAAVKQWQFEPARREEEKVPGDVVLTFTFRK